MLACTVVSIMVGSLASAQSSRPEPISLDPRDLESAKSQTLAADIEPLIERYCGECHGDGESSGELNFDALLSIRPLVAGRRAWIHVIEQLKVGSMPPADADQPSERERRQLVAWLTVAIKHFDYEQVRRAGHVPAKRLSHDEYNHTVRDLVGIDLRPADRFPSDLSASSGFDNSANSLFIQPVNLERFAAASDRIVELAYPDNPQDESTRAARALLLGRSDREVTIEVAHDALARFVSRAFRRPVATTELESLIRRLEDQVNQGDSPYDALRDSLRIILVSPSFLIRSEQSEPQSRDQHHNGGGEGDDHPIADWELANRLSYFLWATMPDEELTELATSHRLHQPAVLTEQIDRMLGDPKAETLGTIFAAQWLGFAHLKQMQPDQIDNPWANDALIEAMQAESAALFNSMIADNEPLDRLLDADYTFVNQPLAKHYRLRGISGDSMRRVSLADNPRRGILGHGSILAVTSFPHRASPVVRGNWILTQLLGTPPPPPPPNVSEFDEDDEDDDLTPRARLERHRDNPNCYACHSQIDPLGFALEHYDWFGRYRRFRSREPDVGAGQLPSGTKFKGLQELSDVLVHERIDDLSHQIATKMLAYALGRQTEYYDQATIEDLVGQMERHDRRIRSLIEGIVLSDTFQKRTSPKTHHDTPPTGKTRTR